MKIQIIDILADDMEDGQDCTKKNFVVTIYGKTKTNLSVVCSVSGYQPYFYLKIPNEYTKSDVNKLFNHEKYGIELLIKNIYSHKPTSDFIKIKNKDIVSYKEFYGFKCEADKSVIKYNFVKLKFTSQTAMNKYSEAIREKYSLLKRLLSNGKHIPSIYKKWIELEKDEKCDSHLYESNINPILRFIH